MPDGYSKKSLVTKLGIKEGTRIALLNPPENYGNGRIFFTGTLWKKPGKHPRRC
jgi:hypothetical protein